MRKRSVTLLVALVMVAGVAFAAQQQGRMGRKGKPTIEQRVSRMKTSLNLTDHQAVQVKELYERQEKDSQAWRSNNPNATRAEMREHRQKMWSQMNKGLKKILTPEQYKKHEEMMRRGMKRHPKRPPQN